MELGRLTRCPRHAKPLHIYLQHSPGSIPAQQSAGILSRVRIADCCRCVGAGRLGVGMASPVQH